MIEGAAIVSDRDAPLVHASKGAVRSMAHVGRLRPNRRIAGLTKRQHDVVGDPFA